MNKNKNLKVLNSYENNLKPSYHHADFKKFYSKIRFKNSENEF